VGPTQHTDQLAVETGKCLFGTLIIALQSHVTIAHSYLITELLGEKKKEFKKIQNIVFTYVMFTIQPALFHIPKFMFHCPLVLGIK